MLKQRTRLDLPKPLHFFTPCSASRNHFLHAQRSGGYSPPISWESTDSTLKTLGRPVLVQPLKKGKPGRRIAFFSDLFGGEFFASHHSQNMNQKARFLPKKTSTSSPIPSIPTRLWPEKTIRMASLQPLSKWVILAYMATRSLHKASKKHEHVFWDSWNKHFS